MHGMELVAGQGIFLKYSNNDRIEISAMPMYEVLDGQHIDIAVLYKMITDLQLRIDEMEIERAKHEQFPALKEAYENYRTIERLCDASDKAQ